MKEFIPLLIPPLAFLGLMEAEKRSAGIHETPGIEEQKRMKEEEEEKEEDIERKRIEKNRIRKKYGFTDRYICNLRYYARNPARWIIGEEGQLKMLSIKKWVEVHRLLGEDFTEMGVKCMIETAKLYGLDITPDNNLITLDMKKIPRDKDTLNWNIQNYIRENKVSFDKIKNGICVTPEILGEIIKGVKAEGWEVKYATEYIIKECYVEEIEKKRGRDFYNNNIMPQLCRLNEGKEALNYLDSVLRKIGEEDRKKIEDREKQKKQWEEERRKELEELEGQRRIAEEKHRIETLKKKEIEKRKREEWEKTMKETPMPHLIIQHYRTLYRDQNIKKQTLKQIQKTLMISTPSSEYTRLKVALHRLVDKKILSNPSRGVYTARKKLFEIDQ